MPMTVISKRRPIVIAIPAMNEEDRITGTLTAIAKEMSAYGGPVSGVVLANNCTDRTATFARDVANRVQLPIFIHEARFEPAESNAGHARRVALTLAEQLCSGDSRAILVTTDADTRPQPGWLAGIEAAIEKGADCVAGAIDFEPEEAGTSPLPALRQLEAEYACLQAELISLADPEPHNPWPNHVWVWGANLAVTREAFLAVDGIPAVPLAEDRAFAAVLRERDLRVRHANEVRVWTSARRQGRAPGGLADLIRIYETDAAYPCDAELQPAEDIYRRARLRRQWREKVRLSSGSHRAFAEAVDVEAAVVEEAAAMPFVGSGWALIERSSSILQPRRIVPTALDYECKSARTIIASLRVNRRDGVENDLLKAKGLWAQFTSSGAAAARGGQSLTPPSRPDIA